MAAKLKVFTWSDSLREIIRRDIAAEGLNVRVFLSFIRHQ